MNDEERINRVEEAIVIMKDLLVDHSERLENYFLGLEKEKQAREEANKDFDFKINALIDAQMRSEARIEKIESSIDKLKETSEIQLHRIVKLEGK